ncbi:hypothetical protein NHX12_010411, partial [Muraenolepis orangiensis]
MADFSDGCTHWRLRPEASIPALKEFTVCMHVQLKVDQWHYFCLTWSERNKAPTLYVDGKVVELGAGCLCFVSGAMSALHRKPRPLIWGHVPRSSGATPPAPLGPRPPLLWGHAPRSSGATLLWGHAPRSSGATPPRSSEATPPNLGPRPPLLWGHAPRSSGATPPAPLGPRPPPLLWGHAPPLRVLREVLSPSVDARWAAHFSRFDCLAHLNVIPSQDVATVQSSISILLQAPYKRPGVLV